MIFYFSGTGNSQLAAKQIAKELQDELVFVNAQLKSGASSIFHATRPLIFVAPTYSWQMPRVLEQWIRDTKFEGNKKAYFILTCGGSVGNAVGYAKKLCQSTQLEFRGLAHVAMPNNYVALSNTPEEEECKTILADALKHLSTLAAVIAKDQPFEETSITLMDKINSGPINKLFYTLMVHDKGFKVKDSCVSCGKCVQRCPLQNITLKDGKPVWHGNCTHCMACIGGCPVEAIEYRSFSKGNRRYYIMEES